MPPIHDALILLSYGGPEGPAEVMPFLRNVTAGRRIPERRLLEVARHYELFDGVSPINAQNRALLAALVNELRDHGHELSVYWGNRHWHPLIPDTMRQMAEDGVQRALAFVTSAYSSYHGCRQYIEAIGRATDEIGPEAPRIDKLRVYYNHPGFIESIAHRVEAAMANVPAERRDAARLLYTAHSIPTAMAKTCAYVGQLNEACRLVSDRLERSAWDLAFQSRSGPPAQPWLEPDVSETLRQFARETPDTDVVVVPIGFTCEHMETIYDLDVAVQAECERLGLRMVRAATVGCHPRFVRMIRELIEERVAENPIRLALGSQGPSHDVCPPGCCPAT